MNKIILTVILGILAYISFAQNQFPVSGNVGIGTVVPSTALEVQGTAIIYNKFGTNYNENLRLPSSDAGYSCIALGAAPGIDGSAYGQWSIIKFPEAQSSKFSIRHFFTDHFNILTNGNIGVGIDNPVEKLAVNGNIRAKEIKVEATNWPDYVFKPEYKLMPLKEVEQHIQQHGHLPDIPKAVQIEEEGLSVGEINKLLMKKIEELTLHLIEKDSKVRLLEDKLEYLENVVNDLKCRL